MINAGDLRSGATIERSGELYEVLGFAHVKQGRGTAFVRAKFKNLTTGAVTEETFRPEEKFGRARIERGEAQLLYKDGDNYVVMDSVTYDQFPLTDNDVPATERVTRAFADFFGDRATELPRLTASEDFSGIPGALGIPYTYWGIGGTDPQAYREATQAGRVLQDIPANHSPMFLPVLQPTLRTGTETLVTAALAWLEEGTPR